MIAPIKADGIFLRNGGLLGLLAAVGSFIAPRLAFAAWNKAAFDGKIACRHLQVHGRGGRDGERRRAVAGLRHR